MFLYPCPLGSLLHTLDMLYFLLLMAVFRQLSSFVDVHLNDVSPIVVPSSLCFRFEQATSGISTRVKNMFWAKRKTLFYYICGNSTIHSSLLSPLSPQLDDIDRWMARFLNGFAGRRSALYAAQVYLCACAAPDRCANCAWWHVSVTCRRWQIMQNFKSF